VTGEIELVVKNAGDGGCYGGIDSIEQKMSWVFDSAANYVIAAKLEVVNTTTVEHDLVPCL